MRTTIGQAAQGDNFYPRRKEVMLLIENIQNGNNLQVAAPRRVGKTSILLYIKDNPIQNHIFVYLDVERVDSENAFYKKLYQEILKNASIAKSKKLLEQFKAGTNKFFKSIRSISLTDAEIEFRDNEEIDYHEELLNFLTGLDLDGQKLVLMIDEFPEVILNIYNDEPENKQSVLQFLQSNRALRNSDDVKKKVVFVYTGSNSLNITVSRFDASALINDLNSIPVKPLKQTEAEELIISLFNSYNYTISNEQLEYLLKRIQWFIPFYCQLLVQEIRLYIDPEEEITNDVIDTCFEHAIDIRNQHFFDHYLSRLNRLFKGDDYRYTCELLNEISNTGSITEQMAFDRSNRYTLASNWKKGIIQALVYDGYLANADNETLVFNSPILKMWWQRHGNK